MDHRNRIRYTILEIAIIFGLQYQINNKTKIIYECISIFLFVLQIHNSQTIIYNGTIIFKIQQVPISYEFIMLLQIKANTHVRTHRSTSSSYYVQILFSQL